MGGGWENCSLSRSPFPLSSWISGGLFLIVKAVWPLCLAVSCQCPTIFHLSLCRWVGNTRREDAGVWGSLASVPPICVLAPCLLPCGWAGVYPKFRQCGLYTDGLTPPCRDLRTEQCAVGDALEEAVLWEAAIPGGCGAEPGPS